MKFLNSTKHTLIAIVTIALATPASAQLANEFFDEKTLKAPSFIAPPGTFESMTSSFVLNKRGFGHEVIAGADVIFKVDAGDSIAIRSESTALASVIASLLGANGVNVVDTEADAKAVLRIAGRYELHLFPHARRVIRANKDFDSTAEVQSPNGLKRQGAGDASIAIGASIASGSLIEFTGSLIRAAVDQSSIAAQIDKANRVEQKIKEQYFRLGDCYDKSTRQSSCNHGTRRNLSLADKTRFQVFVIDARLTHGGEEQTRQFIARRIDDRQSENAHLFDLMTLAALDLANAIPGAKVVGK
jgi:hypothetical protein